MFLAGTCRATALGLCLGLIAASGAACRQSAPQLSTAEIVARGDAFMQQAKYSDAIASFRTALSHDGTNGTVRYKLARALQGAQQWAQSASEAIAAADLAKSRDLEMYAIWWMLRFRRFVDATTRSTAVLQRSPDDALALAYFANAKARLAASDVIWDIDRGMRLGSGLEEFRARLRERPSAADDAAAEKAFKQALALDPTLYEATVSYANFLLASGRTDEGERLLKQATEQEPSRAVLSRTLGLFYYYQGRLDDAERYLRRSAEAGPTESVLALADFLDRTKRTDEAIQLLTREGANPSAPEASVRAAELEFGRGRVEEATRLIEPVLARAKHNPGALRMRAEILLATGQVAAAIEAARSAVDADPISEAARLVLGRAYRAKGDLVQAFENYAEAWRSDTRNGEIAREMADVALALRRHKVALEFAREAVRLSAGDPAAELTLARVLLHTQDFVAAEQVLTKAIAGRAPSPEHVLLLGQIQHGRKNIELARATYNRVLQADPNSVEALTGLVTIEIDSGQAARIRPRVDQALVAHPQEPAYLMLDARVSAATGDRARAESRLRTLLGIDGTHLEAALLLSRILIDQQLFPDARMVLETAVARSAGALPAQMALAALLEKMNLPADARARYETIVKQHPDAAEPVRRLAAIYVSENQNLDIALQLASTAKRLSPDDAAVSDTLGWAYVKKRLPASGVPHLESAVRAAPSNAVYRYHLGIAYERLAQFAKAREELGRALALDPTFPGAADAKTVLAAITR